MNPVLEESDGGRCDLPLEPCLSFNTYTSGRLAYVAGRVCREDEKQASNLELASADFRGQADHLERPDHGGGSRNDDDNDFEFISLVKNSDQAVIGSEYAGPVDPIFNLGIISARREDEERRSIRIPLKSMFLDDRDPLSARPPRPTISMVCQRGRTACGLRGCRWRMDSRAPPAARRANLPA
ncbi:hypothetical protein SAY87_002814 [Trapa incisa]|uniref:Uncharacterized protein n=1 Tax=Trapa incisa TaxID=236973 RepID=A0AAN7JTQ1_9MYRT|nr:hypothetical protein SAY87_002814 [Trapa incisa]